MAVIQDGAGKGVSLLTVLIFYDAQISTFLISSPLSSVMFHFSFVPLLSKQSLSSCHLRTYARCKVLCLSTIHLATSSVFYT